MAAAAAAATAAASSAALHTISTVSLSSTPTKRSSKLHNLTLSRTLSSLSAAGRMDEGLSLFKTLPNPDTFQYNVIIRGYTNTSSFTEAINLYHQMLAANVPPDSYTFPFILKSSASLDSPTEGLKAHAKLLKLGFHTDRFACNTLITFYSTFALVDSGRKVFDEMTVRDRDTTSWNSMIDGYVTNGQGWNSLACFREMHGKPDRIAVMSALAACSLKMCKRLGTEIHCYMVRHGMETDVRVRTSLLDMYCKCGGMVYAERLFTGGNVVTWNVMIGGLVLHNRPEDAFACLREMQDQRMVPDEVTMVNLLPACEQVGSVAHGRAIHCVTIRRRMLPHLLLETALVDMYGKCRELRSAELVFEQMCERSLVSWNTMITAYVANNHSAKALNIFIELVEGPLEPDAFTFSSIIPAYSELASLRHGRQIHSYTMKSGYTMNTYVLNSIVYMYAKCGDLHTSRTVFNTISGKNIVSWNTIIMSYAIHGQGRTALKLFSDMKEDGFTPNETTFVSVLSACGLSGLVEEGWMHFNLMQEEYNITPQIEHYGCMIDLMGRTGDLEQAVEFIKNMALTPTARIWGSLLTASRNSNDIALAEYAADRIYEFEHDNTGCYVILSSMYADAGRWGDVERVKCLINEEGLGKTRARSLVELNSNTRSFVNGDKSCTESKLIHDVSDILSRIIGETSTSTVTTFNMRNFASIRDNLRGRHSARLAVCFGLISSAVGTPILVKKNIRLCDHCHCAIKLISGYSRREIVIGDSTMYHHFRDGVCCCGDYW